MTYNWPGNVRELQNVLERAASVAGDGPILEENLPMEIRNGERLNRTVDQEPHPLKDEMAIAEKRAIQRSLNLANGNRTEAARLLGIHRTGLYQKMRRHGLDGPPKL